MSTECKKHICERDYIWNPATCSCKNGKYLASIIDDSVITCNEIIEETKTVITNFNETNAIFKTKTILYFTGFFIHCITLSIAVSIYCYLIKNRTKQKHLLPLHVTNNKLK